jgi:hypothetical protein
MKVKKERKNEYIYVHVVKGTTTVKYGDLSVTLNGGTHWWGVGRNTNIADLMIYFPTSGKDKPL